MGSCHLYSLKLCLLFVLFAPVCFAAGSSKSCRIKILDLHPTQASIGQKELDHKRKKITKIKAKPDELKAFLKKKVVPVVMGPHGRVYLVDHHHTTLGLLAEGIESVYYQQWADFSDLSEKQFRNQMQARGWVRLRNELGQAISWESLESMSLKDILRDDPYRSLAGMLKRKGDILKIDIPFFEYQWADFLRDKIETPGKKVSWKKSLEQAQRLAHSEDASHLPGFISKK